MDKDNTLAAAPAAAGASVTLSGAEMVIQALRDQGVTHIFGYPGGAVLPIYDALFKVDGITHVLVRHEQGAVHAAEGYARSTGKPGVVLVTSGPGATNAVTGLTDALMDSIPIVAITGQVPSHLIGTDAFQECDTVGITRPCTKNNWLVRDVNELSRTLHEAFQIATTGRPGPVLVDIPKDIQFQKGVYLPPASVQHRSYKPKTDPDPGAIARAVEMMAAAKRPVFYTGGGIINSGPEASKALRELVDLTGFPVTSTLMGLGAFPASRPEWLGMLGMHGTWEANHAMHDCDLLICLGARFDDRVTGRVGCLLAGLEANPSGYRRLPDQQGGACRSGHRRRCRQGDPRNGRRCGRPRRNRPTSALKEWWAQIDTWRGRKSLAFKNSDTLIKPQYAVDRLYELTKGTRRLHHHRSRPAPDVGGAALQVRAAQSLDDLAAAWAPWAMACRPRWACNWRIRMRW